MFEMLLKLIICALLLVTGRVKADTLNDWQPAPAPVEEPAGDFAG